MNGWVKKVLIGVGLTFAAFTVHWIYIDRPSTYATKGEVNEIKCDITERLQRIENKVDRIVERGK